jgi:hypothetical protein
VCGGSRTISRHSLTVYAGWAHLEFEGDRSVRFRTGPWTAQAVQSGNG